ncbi:hypothetical protein LR69_04258 [Geobacillus sp. BCO2]|nr:hypothetical protein LR69_04258 [Geobacillus sp. BCO2]
MAELQKARTEWLEQKQLIEKSVDPSPEVLSALQLAEAKYFFSSVKRSTAASHLRKCVNFLIFLFFFPLFLIRW